jgi:hypothetical protein
VPLTENLENKKYINEISLFNIERRFPIAKMQRRRQKVRNNVCAIYGLLERIFIFESFCLFLLEEECHKQKVIHNNIFGRGLNCNNGG